MHLVEDYRNAEWQPRQRGGGASLGNATLPAGDSRRFVKAVEEPINGHNRLLDGTLPAAGLKPVVSLAAGFASQQNLTRLREFGYSYLINLTRGNRQNYAAEFCRQRLPDRAVNQQVEVRKIPAPEAANSSLVLCRSAQRRRQEVAMISTAEQRFLNDSERLQARIAKGKLKREALIYMTLLRAEQGFSGLQGALGLRPHFHQRGYR